MTRESQLRAAAVVLALCTVAVIVFGVINFQKEREYIVPDDGVWWLESGGQLSAERVTPLGPGERAGLKAGDQLTDINGRPIHTGGDRVRKLFRVGTYSKATYGVNRGCVRGEMTHNLVSAVNSSIFGLQLIDRHH